MRSAILTGCLWMLCIATNAQFRDRVPSGTPLRWGMNGSVEAMPADLAYYYGRTDSSTAYRRNLSTQSSAAGGNTTATRFAAVRSRCENNALLLSWVAVQQFGADRYEIEQSTNGRHWTVVGVVPANRTDYGEASYTFQYNKDVRDVLFRITATNIAGERVYSSIVQSPCDNTAALAVTPNPVYSTATVRIGSATTAKVALVVVDARGVVVQRKEAGLSAGINDISLDMSSLIRGNYTLVLHWANGREETLSLIKQ